MSGHTYHVINRAVMRLQIFNSNEDYLQLEKIIEATQKEIDMHIFAYIIMPNHWHFLLSSQKDGDLGLFMHRLTNAHTRQVRAKTKTTGTGPLYQGRYKSFIIENDPHLLTVLKYIERNPVRAKLSQETEDWRWGSAWRRIYGNDNQKKLLATTPVDLPVNYLQWVNMTESEKELDGIRSSVNKGVPYGRESWVEKTAKQFNLEQTMRNPGRPKRAL